MRPRPLARHTRRATNALVLLACALLLAATPAAARVAYDVPPGTPAAHAPTAPARPIIINDTTAQDDNGGLGTLGFALIATGAIVALLGAGYLGARIASNHGHHPAT
jgi:hypothetical protein